MRLEQDPHGRRRVDLFRLPRWAQLLIALAIVGLVVALTRFVDPNPATPPWLPGAIHASGWVYLALVLVAVVSWLMRRRKR